MQFRIYDVLASLIPGCVLLFTICLSFFLAEVDPVAFEQKVGVYKDLSGVFTTVFIVFGFLVGYFVHGLGSLVEPILWFTWGGRPSKSLLNKFSKRLGLPERESIRSFLVSKLSEDSPIRKKEGSQYTDTDYWELFQVGKNIANSSAKEYVRERITEFNGAYAFSRNILVSFFLCFVLVIWLGSKDLVSLTWIWISIPALIFFWWRCRDRAFYYSREIFTGAYYSRS